MENGTRSTAGSVDVTMNGTLNGSVAYVELPPYNVPLTFRRVQISIAAAILIVGCFLNGLLLQHFRKTRLDHNQRTPPAKTLITCISVVSLLVLITGIPILIALLVMDFSPYYLCDYLSYVHYHILFYGNALVLHFITVVLFDRYSALTNARFKIDNQNIKRVIVAITAYVSVVIAGIMAIRALENDRSRDGTTFNHCHFANHVAALKRSGEGRAYGTTVIVAVLITMCNVFMARYTRKTLGYIKQVNKRTEESSLGEQIQPLETKRVKVAFLLGILFDSMWIPFGIIATLQYRAKPEVTGIVKVFLHLATYASFGVFPAIYASMDRRYMNFLYKNIFFLRKNAVGNAQ